MILLDSLQDLSAASGLFDVGTFENIYHTFMDTALNLIGRTITLHLRPAVEVDTATQSAAQSQRPNPFFGGRVPLPNTVSRNTGKKITPRDVHYNAQIRIGPMPADDTQGIGELKENEIAVTIDVAAIPHLQETLTFSVEGRRYKIDESRPVGFSKRQYIIVFGTEINEIDTDTSENAG